MPVKENDVKRRAERGVAESFLLAYNSVTRSAYIIDADGEAPDFICRDPESGDRLGLEIATAYYDEQTAKGLWEMIRGRSDRASGSVINPEATLADRLNQRLREKWKKDYGPRCVLALHADAELTSAAEFDETVLPSLEMPAEESPFEAVYVRLAGKNAEPEMVWWQLYPRKRRFYQQMRGLGGAAPGRAGRAPLHGEGQRGGGRGGGTREGHSNKRARDMARQHNTNEIEVMPP